MGESAPFIVRHSQSVQVCSGLLPPDVVTLFGAVSVYSGVFMCVFVSIDMCSMLR